MSVKGCGQTLLIGKQSISIRDWMYNTKTISYDDMTKIEYCFRAITEGGYMDFHDSMGQFVRFHFTKKSNDAIQRAVGYISEHYPELELEQHCTESDPFYAKNIFIVILSVFWLWPIGLILCWCTGKRTLKERIVFTSAVLIIQISFLVFWLYYTQLQINTASDALNNYFNQINNIFR